VRMIMLVCSTVDNRPEIPKKIATYVVSVGLRGARGF